MNRDSTKDESLQDSASPKPRLRLRGLWAGQGFDVTEEDIVEARREMWRGVDARNLDEGEKESVH